MKGPIAKEVEKVLELHGDQRVDEFFWMKNHPSGCHGASKRKKLLIRTPRFRWPFDQRSENPK